MTSGRRIRVRGQVQGVGFRPFVWQLARRLGIMGEVLNDAEGVLIHAHGGALEQFEVALRIEAPPLAVVDAVESIEAEVAPHTDFVIAKSGDAGAETRVTPDAATCPECLAEIRDPENRRAGYAFANCTNCGPRFTILNGLPYDRAQTTMAPFDMCAACKAEYQDPADRRFHAQPVACSECGPRVWAETSDGRAIDGEALDVVVNWLRGGAIVGIKGLGGFHLACDARNEAAIATLRRRKRRPGKPFALMARIQDVRQLAGLTHEEERLLVAPCAPVVLVGRQNDGLPDNLAPGQARLGWMLPYTPLHHLLLDRFQGPVVMTSGNLSGEPQVIGNAEARSKLSAFVDGFLMHDRDIARRLDDGVECLGPLGPVVLRRARGRVPGTFDLPRGLSSRQVLAMGGQLKSAICLTKNGQALLSHHLGDLDDVRAVEEFQKADADLAALFDHQPAAIAVDLHPDFRATRHGVAKAEALGLPVVTVQHHHAHMAAALGEAGWHGATAVGIILDGLGLGPDGTVWGGEILVGNYAQVTRVARISPAPLVGGDRAQSEPWRNAVMRLDAAGLSDLADRLFPENPRKLLRQVASAGVNATLSSSAGRLFDAVGACLGLAAQRQSYEGETAMLLEAAAINVPRGDGYSFSVSGGEIDPAPVFRALARDISEGTPSSVISGRFHRGLAHATATAARDAAHRANTSTIALSGGCFQNMTLLGMVMEELEDFQICGPGQVPAGDGGLAFGQAIVALAQMESA